MGVSQEPGGERDAVRVVVGAVIVRAGKTLAARRIGPAELAGRWEFPGGKVEPGEAEADALIRECDEELGVTIDVLDRIGPDVPLPGGAVLRCYFAQLRQGLSNFPDSSSDHDELRWLEADELDSVDWLPGDRPIVEAVRARLDEGERFAGGRVGGAVRIGDTVRRPAGPWTPAVHALLAHVRAAGLPYVPEVLGFDELGREVLRYVPGETFGNDDWPAWTRSDALLEQAMRWLAAYHEAVRDFRPKDAVWRLDSRELASDELICHNDLAPYNVLVTDPAGELRLAGVLDWDVAGPGKPIDDLAFAAWHFLSLWDGEVSAAEAARKLRLQVSAYGDCSAAEVLRHIPVRVNAGVERIRKGAAAGDPGMRNLLSTGNLEGHQRAVAALAARFAEIETALGE
ncbi:NUDIX domain-containing protein [Flindersiella endophytica]